MNINLISIFFLLFYLHFIIIYYNSLIIYYLCTQTTDILYTHITKYYIHISHVQCTCTLYIHIYF